MESNFYDLLYGIWHAFDSTRIRQFCKIISKMQFSLKIFIPRRAKETARHRHAIHRPSIDASKKTTSSDDMIDPVPNRWFLVGVGGGETARREIEPGRGRGERGKIEKKSTSRVIGSECFRTSPIRRSAHAYTPHSNRGRPLHSQRRSSNQPSRPVIRVFSVFPRLSRSHVR